MARCSLGWKKIKKYRNKTGLDILAGTVRGGTDHRVDLFLSDSSIISLHKNGELEKMNFTWDVKKWYKEHKEEMDKSKEIKVDSKEIKVDSEEIKSTCQTYVRFGVIKKCETDKDILVEHDGIEVWIPKSQIEDIEEIICVGGEELYELTIPEWLAIDKELV